MAVLRELLWEITKLANTHKELDSERGIVLHATYDSWEDGRYLFLDYSYPNGRRILLRFNWFSWAGASVDVTDSSTDLYMRIEVGRDENLLKNASHALEGNRYERVKCCLFSRATAIAWHYVLNGCPYLEATQGGSESDRRGRKICPDDLDEKSDYIEPINMMWAYKEKNVLSPMLDEDDESGEDVGNESLYDESLQTSISGYSSDGEWGFRDDGE